MEKIQSIKYYTALVGVAFGYIVGALDGLLIALIIFMVFDYITGVIDAIIQKKLSSQVGFIGILKKIAILMLVSVGNIIDVYILKGGAAVRTSVIFFYLCNEGISILENIALIGVPIPEKLRDVLINLNDKD